MKRLGCLGLAVFATVALAAQYTPRGEVAMNGISVSFDDHQIVGPMVSVSRRADGSWAGTIGRTAVEVNAAGDRITGSNLNLRVERNGTSVVVAGTWNYRTVRFDIGATKATVRIGNHQAEYERQADGVTWRSPSVVTRYTMTLAGDAQAHAMPQTALALLACGMPNAGADLMPPRHRSRW